MTSATDPSVSILLVEDEMFYRLGILEALEEFQDRVHIIGTATNAVQAINLVRTQQPDVVIVDLNIPRSVGIGTTNDPRVENGINLIQEIYRFSSETSETPKTRTLVLSGHAVDREPFIVFEALRAGAHGYLAKRDCQEANQLWTAIENVLRDEPVYGASIAALMLKYQSLVSILTQREQEVLELLAGGKSNIEIAQILTISLPTVKSHVGNILSKLHLKSRSEVKALFDDQKGS